MQTRRSVIATALAFALLPRTAAGQTGSNVPPQRGTTMKIRCIFGQQSFTASLLDNPSARDLSSMLPLDLSIEDYSTNEKIAHLPRKLTEEGSGPFSGEARGDLCYFAPWGNLAFFHGDYRYSQGLIRLGRLDGGPAPLLVKGKFPLRIELVP